MDHMKKYESHPLEPEILDILWLGVLTYPWKRAEKFERENAGQPWKYWITKFVIDRREHDAVV